MPIQWMLRLAMVAGLLIAATTSDAQQVQPGGGGSAKAAPSGGGAKAAPSDGGGAKAAPSGNSSAKPAAPSGNNSSNDNRPATPPPTARPAPANPAGTTNPPPASETQAPTGGAKTIPPTPVRTHDQLRERLKEHLPAEPRPKKDLVDRSNPQQPVVVFPYSFRGVTPWWYGGGYGYPWYRYDDDRGYYGDDYYNGDAYGSAPSNEGSPGVNNLTPRPQPPIPTGPSAGPIQDQARSINQLEGTPEFRQLSSELAKAQAAYDAASARVVEKLKDDPEYQRLVNQREHADDRVEAVQAGARIPDPVQVTPAAERKMKLSSAITKMEQQAIAADPQAAAARKVVMELNDRVTALRKQAQSAPVAR